ncbi:MAG: hypothetical protein IT450_21270 [Phycisphaerales bacterium]|nr:hypothetical protein [Phycisphaerales bacterium]
MADFLPRPDGDFGAWARHFFDELKLWWAAEGLKLSDLDPLQQALTAWETEYPQHVAAQAAAEAARQAKDAARASLVAAVRPVARFVQAWPTTTNAARVNMGLPARDGAQGQGSGFAAAGSGFAAPGSGFGAGGAGFGGGGSGSAGGGSGGGPVSDRSFPRMAAAGRGAGRPMSRPLVRVDTSRRLLHTLRFSDESTPTRRRKPPGTLGAEIWLALTAPAAAPPPPGDAYRFVAVNSRGTAPLDFAASAAGQTACYLLRWLSTRGEPGPWSETAAATVGA